MEHITQPSSPKHFLAVLALLVLISRAQSSTNFIDKSCSTTTYPSLCKKTLTPFAPTVGTNPLRLCSAALRVAIQATGNCSSTVTKLLRQKGVTRGEASAIRECMGDLKDAVYELKQTVGAMSHMKDGDREFQWANAKTYASAAITDAETCVDGFLGRKVNPVVKKKIKSCVSGVEKLISNALSLINHLY